jgi:hypothetical protein
MSIFDEAGRLAQGVLAVVGGAVIGAIVTGFLTNSAVQVISARRLPPLMLRWVRIFSGLGIGAIVGYAVFSGVGGWQLGGAGGTDTGAGVPVVNIASDEPRPGPPAPTRAAITLLGGMRVRGTSFYLIDGVSAAKSLGELGAVLPATPGILTLRIYDDSVSRDHAAVTELIGWAERLGWKVVIEELKGQSLPAEVKRS